jgi:hypothetical protein
VVKKANKKKKEPSIADIEKQCLQLWSKCVRTKQRVCRLCGSDERLQAHHIRSVSHKATYLDLENGLCVCAREHMQQKYRPEWFQDRVIECIGDEEYQRMKTKSQQIYKPTLYEIKMMKDLLKSTLKSLEADYGVLNAK